MSADANISPVAPAPAPTASAPNPHPAAVQPPPAGASPGPVFNVYAQPPANPSPAGPTAVAAAPPAPGLPAGAGTGQQMVSLPLEQLQAFTSIQARLAQMEAEQRTQQQQAQQDQARILAQKGEVENALALLRQQAEQDLQVERKRAQTIEQSAARYALDGELSRALAAHNLVAGGADQLATLWRGNFTAVNENGTFAVRTPTFETPAQFVQRQLVDPNYAHFLRATNQGGTATGQTAQAAPTPPSQPAQQPQPKNMGEAVILHMQGQQKASGDARANMGLPFGLGRVAGS